MNLDEVLYWNVTLKVGRQISFGFILTH